MHELIRNIHENKMPFIKFSMCYVTVNKDAAIGRMNIQLLEDPSGELSLCLTYGDQWYLRETVENVMGMLQERIIKLVRNL